MQRRDREKRSLYTERGLSCLTGNNEEIVGIREILNGADSIYVCAVLFVKCAELFVD